MPIINTAMPDVKLGIQFVKNAKIVKENQLLAFLKEQKIKEERCKKIISIMLKNKFVYQHQNSEYISVTTAITYMNFSETQNKAIWFYIKNCNKSDFVNFECKYPCVLYTSNFATPNVSFSDLTVFYVKMGDESLMSRIIDTNFGYHKEPFKTAIILDDIQQISKISLPEVFEIVMFTTISKDGVINNYTYGGTQIEYKN